MRNLVKLFAFLLFLGAVLFPVSAFASSNSGAEISGEGTAPISGWTVSNIHYQLSDNPSFVAGVAFDLDSPAGRVSVKLVSSETEFSNCTNPGGNHWECRVQGVGVASMDEFRVIAVGN
jgi:hypothetical protein